jgi:hypothetical protein
LITLHVLATTGFQQNSNSKDTVPNADQHTHHGELKASCSPVEEPPFDRLSIMDVGESQALYSYGLLCQHQYGFYASE